ncbi:MAG: methylmalonyl Co-A mutase-associated GTPase MeaB [Gemmatimonadetes bacterium]|nr:methylmalonyl Co-A mutase-associated GTPase MeaB [Gemmatimonadota bacterium]NNM04459.1 methylmalonyl Co-A mutase-associated GTPase MeaB [Gemmatimonadota bacterium]
MTPGISTENQALLERFRAGKKVALARAISLVEDERPGFQAFLHAALETPRFSKRVGFTGPPGAGKSTLVAALTREFRDRSEDVAVVAVDPTSPYSGGALLGDRIRMNDLATDPGIFIRSMATRGSLGGLAATTREVLDLMDAFGFQRVLVETVGVGQTELEITGAADTVVVILVPESGDAIQAMKAGLMEIADIFVVNKSDRPGADRLVKDLRLALHLREGEALKDVPAHHGVDLKRMGARGDRGESESEEAQGPTWEIPVLQTVAHSGEGVDDLLDAVAGHRAYLEESGVLLKRREARAADRVRDVVERELRKTAWNHPGVLRALEAGVAGIVSGTETPYSLAGSILSELLGSGTK